MVSVLDSGSSGPGSGPGREHCVVFLGKTPLILSQCLSPPRYRIFSIKRWTPIKRRPRLNAASKLLIFK